MTDTHIDKLLERYFGGQTSLEEEAALRDYFAGGEVAAAHAVYQPLFRSFAAERATGVSEAFTAAFLQRIAAPPVTSTTPVRRLRRRLASCQRVAAVLLLVGASLFVAQECRQWSARTAATAAPQGPVAAAAIDWSKYEVTDEAEALRITRAALGATSKQLNQNSRRAATRVHTELRKVLQ